MNADSLRAASLHSRKLPARTGARARRAGTSHLHRAFAALLIAAAVAACGDDCGTPTDLVIPVFSHGANHAGGHFGTHMSGGLETPPRPSSARGQLVLRLDASGALVYRLLVAGIRPAR